MYEFDSVRDRETGEDKLVLGSRYANPVHIISASVGGSAFFKYVDADYGFKTSLIDSLIISSNHIHILTENTNYWLSPYLRESDNEWKDSYYLFE